MKILEISGQASTPVITLPHDARVLVVEDRIERQNWFLERIPQAVVADLAHLANQLIREQMPDVVFLDYDLHRFNSEDTAKLLATIRFSGRVYIHSLNAIGPERLLRFLGGLPQVEVSPYGTFEIKTGLEVRP